jgi:hypothetical protein
MQSGWPHTLSPRLRQPHWLGPHRLASLSPRPTSKSPVLQLFLISLVLVGIVASPASYAAFFGATLLQPSPRKQQGTSIVVKNRVVAAASVLVTSPRASRQRRPSAAMRSPGCSPLLLSGYPQDGASLSHLFRPLRC